MGKQTLGVGIPTFMVLALYLQGNMGIPEETGVGYGDVWEEGLKHTPFHQFLKVTGGATNRTRMRNDIFVNTRKSSLFFSFSQRVSMEILH